MDKLKSVKTERLGERKGTAETVAKPKGASQNGRARFNRLLKNSCFVSGHDFSRAVKG
jgi:hypothetical protein